MRDASAYQIKSLQDLADLAGVSRATASRALSNSPLVSDKTRRKIQVLAEKHRYTVNQKARDFRLKRTRVISVVFMFDVRSEQHMSDPFFLEMLGGIADALAAHDYDLLLAHAPVLDVLALRETRVFQNADGVIFVGQGEQHGALNDLAHSETPVVVWGGPVPDREYTLVGGDNTGGGYAAARHLIDLGRRRIAFLGNTRNPEIAARYAGYERALTEAGLLPDRQLIVDVPFDMEHARKVIGGVLSSSQEIDALVCASDVVALAAISTLNTHDLRVPEDVAVVGYDDIGLAAYSTPALTTVRQNIHESGRMLVASILGLVNNHEVSDTVLSSELIVRGSCGANPASAD